MSRPDFGRAREALLALEAKLARLEQESAEKTLQLNQLRKAAGGPAASSAALFPSIGELAASNASATNASAAADEDDDAPTFDETGIQTSEAGVTEIQSLCMNCHENGVTRMLLTKIPYFREVVLTSFSCPACGFKDTEVQNASGIQPKGHTYTWKVTDAEQISSRQILKADTGTLRINELDFEIPPHRGVISTLEGLLSEAAEQLEETQPRRRLLESEETVAAVDAFIQKLQSLMRGEILPFTVVLDDPAGNSFVDNPNAPAPDANLSERSYHRTKEQQVALGFTTDEQAQGSNNKVGIHKEGAKLTNSSIRGDSKPGDHLMDKALVDSEDVSKEILSFPAECPSCFKEGEANNCIVKLPFFKDIVIMAFNCEFCGLKDTEVKAGGEISKMGRRDILRVSKPEDLTRDVIKSDTAGVYIPELSFESTRGSLGGMYTSVEGLLMRFRDDIFQRGAMLAGDSLSNPERTARFAQLEKQFEDCLNGKMEFTMIIEDPLASSYVYSPCADPKEDPMLLVEDYARTWDEDEELGLHDMKVDGYDAQDIEHAAPLAQPDDSNLAAERMRAVQVDGKDVHPSAFAHGSTEERSG